METIKAKQMDLNNIGMNFSTEKTNLNNSKSDPNALKEACEGMESIFLNIMLKEMRKTIPKSGLMPDTLAKDIYTSLFDQHLSQEVAKAGKGIGIAEMLFDYFSQR